MHCQILQKAFEFVFHPLLVVLVLPSQVIMYLHMYSFGWPKCVSRWVKFPKYVCLVARLGKQLLEKQILKIILDILWQNGINSYQYNTAWEILLFVSGTCFCCLLVPLKVTPHHGRVSCLIIGLTINAIE